MERWFLPSGQVDFSSKYKGSSNLDVSRHGPSKSFQYHPVVDFDMFQLLILAPKAADLLFDGQAPKWPLEVHSHGDI